MKPSDYSSRRPFNPTESAPDFRAPIAVLETPQPLTFPRFPSVEELLLHATGVQPHPLLKLTETAPPSEPESLFKGFLGGRLDVLTQDAATNPDRYDEATRIFLEELAGGARKLEALTPTEAEILDRAVMDYASVRPQNKPVKEKERPKEKKPALLREAGELPDEHTSQVELPDDALDTAPWWA
jgi:hypothetical protein